MVQFYSQKKNGPQSRKLAILAISELDHFGQGVAKHNGKTIFVPGALPGENVEVMINGDDKQYAYVKVIRRLNDSSCRIEPCCRHYLQCGGCQQLHVQTELQRISKVNALFNIIARETKVSLPITEPIFAQELHYRRRARLDLQYFKAQKLLIMGYRKASSNDLISINECAVLCEELEKLISPIRECLSNLKRAHKLDHLELILADNGPVVVLRHIGPLPDDDIILLRRLSKEHNTSIYLIGDEWQGLLIGEEPYYDLGELRLYFNPHGFIQVNSAVNEMMIEQALEWLDVQPTERVLDLFCGIGNFSLPIALQAAEVVGVEGVPESIAQARYNGIANNIKNVQFYHADLRNDFIDEPWVERGFDKILLDPARAGAYEIIASIARLDAKRIVYISCNAATLARDSKILLESGYHLANLRMLDMFPQTSHLESMALFIKD